MTRNKDGFVTIPQALRLLEFTLILELIDKTLWRAYLENHLEDAPAVLAMFAARFRMPPSMMEALRASFADARNRSARVAMLRAAVRYICTLELPTPDDFYSGPRLLRRIDLSRLSTPVGDLSCVEDESQLEPRWRGDDLNQAPT